MSLVTKFVQDLADHWPLDTLVESPIRRRVWIGLLQLLQPSGAIDVSYYGMRLHVDPQQRQTLARQALMRCGYESFPTEIVRRLLTPGMTFVDVGANFGHYTLIAAQCVGSTGRVVSVEPSPIVFQELAENVAINRLEQVDLHRVALGASLGTATLYHDARRGGHHSLGAENIREPGLESVVDVTTLDELRRAMDRPVDLLKLDTQGSEVAILAGAHSTLSADRPIILTEYWPYGITHVGDPPQAFAEFLSVLDYRLLRIGSGELQPTTFDDLQVELSPWERRHDTNLLCIPAEYWSAVTDSLEVSASRSGHGATAL